MWILEQHDGFAHYFCIGVSDNKETLERWKTFLEKQAIGSPAKRNGEFFEISEVPKIMNGEVPSISRVRELLGLKGTE